LKLSFTYPLFPTQGYSKRFAIHTLLEKRRTHV
jgi:hypothetical protein